MARPSRVLLPLFVYLTWSVTVTHSYIISNHPCCREPSENLTLAMVIDAYEIYGHDPTDKLDHLAHYQLEMMKIKRAPDQYIINEHIHIATDHLARFIHMHLKELKVLLIALDDTIDNMLTMYDNHNAIKTERVATYNSAAGGAVPSEFYMSQEFYCGKNVYIFISEMYSDIYNMGRGPTPYCKGRAFHFMGFVHFMDDKRYFLEEDPNVIFSMDNFVHGLECNIGICMFRFPFKKNLQHVRDVSTLPKAIVKCGTEMYKLPPLTAASCLITSGSFILDFNIQGVRFRHHDYMLLMPNGHTYYTKEKYSPLFCDHHVCEWNFTNFYGGPFIIPGDPGTGLSPVPPFIEQTSEAFAPTTDNPNGVLDPDSNITYSLDGCWYMFPPNYGSIAGISYLDPLAVNEYRFTCQGSGNKGLYWYPQWMGASPHHPYPAAGDGPSSLTRPVEPIFYPHQQASPPSTNLLPERH
ncbi:unnamed protein product [Spodoptera littoralis]|uniref:Uncharacterized protein n=1 Tax=Spodoptera littoralis TaxID=7109 RepID=A0A9P0N3Y3_SPOLI|nr:unnamed protein product [Spodoptera littoralis]CAH1640649.1 unnamed protein product [Spodoptera littoralis]